MTGFELRTSRTRLTSVIKRGWLVATITSLGPYPKVRRLATALQAAGHSEGWTGSVSLLGTYLAAGGRRMLGEYRFDRRHRVKTRGITSSGVIQTISSRHGDALGYQATPVTVFARALHDLDIEPSAYTFVDLGCGKGRVLLLASEQGFRRVIGVELSPDLLDVARKNVRQLQKTDPDAARSITLVLADAADYMFPDEPTVLYLYNPFGETTMRTVLGALVGSLHTSPRPLCVIYYNPVLRFLFDELEMFEPVATGASYSSFRALVTDPWNPWAGSGCVHNPDPLRGVERHRG